MEKKISNLNDEFDLGLFIKVVKNNIAWIILFFIIAFLMAFLYLRYTYPIYSAKAIIQIQPKNDNTNVLQIKDYSIKSDLPSKIELLKSAVFLDTVFSKLPLDVSYYQIGNVLNFEMYKTSPFEIEYRNQINELNNIPVYFSFTDEKNVNINTNVNNIERTFRIQTEKWVRLPIIDSVIVHVRNYEKIRKDMKGVNEYPYYVVFSRKENLVRQYYSTLEVVVENEAAGTVEIYCYERNAAKASNIVNTLVEEFKKYDIAKQSESADNTIKFVDNQLKIFYDKLYDSEVELQNFKTANKLNDDTPLPDFSNRINDLEKQLNELQLQESSLKIIEQAILENENMDIYKLISILSGGKQETSLESFLSELRKLISKKQDILYSRTKNSNLIAVIDYQIDVQRKLIYETIKASLSDIYNKKNEVENRIVSYEDEIKRSALSFDRIEFIRLQILNTINQGYYNKLVEIKSQLSISNAGITSENRLLEASTTPTVPFFPSQRIVVLGALIGWFLVSLALIIIRYLFHNEITSMNEIFKHISVPMLGIVPNYRDTIPISQLLVDKKPKSIIAESLRSIRSNLEFLSKSDGPKVLAITSTISGEGKTFVALNLAGIIAFSEKKVIILDLDMRKPKIHVGFGVPNDKGMSTILINRNSIQECVFKSSLNNLDFITAGPVPPNPSELIISARMVEVLNELKNSYDLIVIDNPPIGLVTDGIKIIKMADYPVYVFRENFSKRNFVQNVKKLINDNNITNLSIIVNSVDIKRSGYGYSGVYDYDYGYGYGYGFGYYDEDIRRDKFNIKEFFKNLISK